MTPVGFAVRILASAGFVAALLMSTSARGAGSSQGLLRVGDRLPPLKGHFLTGRDAVLPQASSGKVALVAMGFTYGSRLPVEAWGNWFRATIGPRADVTFFEVPMIGGFATLGRWFIDRGMRNGTPVELHERVITVYGGTGDWKKRLSYSAEHKDDAYLVVLDGEGVVRWLHHGAFAQPRADELQRLVISLADKRSTAAGPDPLESANRPVTSHEPAASGRPAVLVTGATGYIGGRLVPALEAEEVRLRCLARRPSRARVARVVPRRRWSRAIFSIRRHSIALSPASTWPITSCTPWARTATTSRRIASPRATSARRRGERGFDESSTSAVSRRMTEALSPHLRSRIETGEVLRASGVPVVEFRASVVIGSGSLSFELIRALVDRLPVMICPRWVSTLAQPIGIDDLLAYLVAALHLPGGESRTFEIGGADRASYGDLMREYARQRGLQRVMISVPLLTPRLSSLWLGLVTPVYARVGRELIAGLKNRSMVTDPVALSVFPIKPIGLADAISRAIRHEDRAFALTRWSDARSSGGEPPLPAETRFGNRLVDARRIHVAVDADRAFVPIARIGGEQGWYYATWLWRIRGALDLLLGGVGMRRGRRDPNALAAGDTLDFWRVEACEPGRRLRLAAEMKLPGRAWLEFEVVPAAGGADVHQTAVFEPAGLSGLLYWYALFPVHTVMFRGLLRAIARRAVEGDADLHRVAARVPL